MLRTTSIVLLCLLCSVAAAGSGEGPAKATRDDFVNIAALRPDPLACRTGGQEQEAEARYRAAWQTLAAKPEAVPLAAKLLADADAGVRLVALDIVADRRPAGAEKALLAAANAIRAEAREPGSYYKAAHALVACNTPLGDELLMWLLEHKFWRGQVIQALGWTRRPGMAAGIVGYLDDARVAESILAACMRMGDPAAVPKIRAYVARISAKDAKAPPEMVRQRLWDQALTTLWVLDESREGFDFIARQMELGGNIQPPHMYCDFVVRRTLPAHVFEQYLKQDCTHRFHLARRYMMFETFGIGATTSDPAGLKRWEQRYQRLGDKVLPLLLDCLEDPDEMVRREAPGMLATRARHISEDEKRAIRAAVVKFAAAEGRKPSSLPMCLAAYRDDQTVSLLVRLAGYSSGCQIEAARELMIQIDPVAGTKVMRELLSDREPQIRQSAAANLLTRGDDTGMPAMFEAARSDNDNYAFAFAQAIARYVQVELRREAFLADRDGSLAKLNTAWQALKSAQPIRGKIISLHVTAYK